MPQPPWSLRSFEIWVQSLPTLNQQLGKLSLGFAGQNSGWILFYQLRNISKLLLLHQNLRFLFKLLFLLGTIVVTESWPKSIKPPWIICRLYKTLLQGSWLDPPSAPTLHSCWSLCAGSLFNSELNLKFWFSSLQGSAWWITYLQYISDLLQPYALSRTLRFSDQGLLSIPKSRLKPQLCPFNQ